MGLRMNLRPRLRHKRRPRHRVGVGLYSAALVAGFDILTRFTAGNAFALILRKPREHCHLSFEKLLTLLDHCRVDQATCSANVKVYAALYSSASGVVEIFPAIGRCSFARPFANVLSSAHCSPLQLVTQVGITQR